MAMVLVGGTIKLHIPSDATLPLNVKPFKTAEPMQITAEKVQYLSLTHAKKAIN